MDDYQRPAPRDPAARPERGRARPRQRGGGRRDSFDTPLLRAINSLNVERAYSRRILVEDKVLVVAELPLASVAMPPLLRALRGGGPVADSATLAIRSRLIVALGTEPPSTATPYAKCDSE